MKTLAKGHNADAIFKLIKVLINEQQHAYEIVVDGQTENILDVASQIETNRSLFGESDKGLETSGSGADKNTKNKKNENGRM